MRDVKYVTHLIKCDGAIVQLIDVSVTRFVDVRPSGSLNLKSLLVNFIECTLNFILKELINNSIGTIAIKNVRKD